MLYLFRLGFFFSSSTFFCTTEIHYYPSEWNTYLLGDISTISSTSNRPRRTQYYVRKYHTFVHRRRPSKDAHSSMFGVDTKSGILSYTYVRTEQSSSSGYFFFFFASGRNRRHSTRILAYNNKSPFCTNSHTTYGWIYGARGPPSNTSEPYKLRE